ncbi:DUF58 domain-containing protein [Microbacterium sp. SS28]|uniref:DUF58 domain-containing protein n=1 Tax=Microbacterium sp. SS28 TaxID=2919948 RepID=UPI001FAB1509|nr:DUF58 domain-containing protein [Microbacterium sp. SS28]
MRRLWPFTVRGSGALALGIACFIVANELGVVELMYFGMLLLGVLVAAWVSLHLVRRTDRVTRSLSPDVGTVGRTSTVVTRVGVRSPFPTAPGTWQDALPLGVGGVARGSFPAIGSGFRGAEKSVELEYTVTGVRRGIHSLGPLTVTSMDPFGLARRRMTFADHAKVTIAPASIELSPLINLLGDAGGTLHSQTNHLGQGADNLVARPYVPGDSMRRIHWRASAHRGDLMVRQEEQESTPDAVVVLDRGVLRYTADALASTGSDPGFETAVSIAISVLTRLVQDGYAVDIIDTDGTPLAEHIDGGDMTAVEDVRTHFATLTARKDDHLQRLSKVFLGVMTGPVVLVTGRFDRADADAIAPIVHHSSLPILLAVSPTQDALGRALDAGWHAASVPPFSEMASAWTAVVERGVSRAFR